MALSEVQVLNTVGIELIHERDLQEAAAAFSRALSQLSWCTLSPTPINEQQQPSALSAEQHQPPQQQAQQQAQQHPAPQEHQHQAKSTNVSPALSLSQAPKAQQQPQQQPQRPTEAPKKKSLQTMSLDDMMLEVEDDEDLDIDDIDFDDFDDEEDASEQEIEVYCFEENAADPTREEFFCHGFHFECQNVASPVMSSQQHYGATICCLFNLALCHHLEWQRRNRMNPQLLLSALGLYDQVVSLAASSVKDKGVPLSPDDDLLKVVMAAGNNATHCQFELGNPHEATRWNGMLCGIVEFCSNSTENGGNNFFSTNAFLNSFPRPSAQAA